jgi:uncharacterized protein (TIGR00251 family)
MDIVEERANAVRLRVRVQPRASRTEVAGEHGGALKVRIASPPVEGEANRELIRFIAKRVGVAASRVTLVSGETGRNKVIEIAGIDGARVRAAFGL